MNTTPNKPATWFWIVSIIGLLWNLVGVMSFIMQITMSEEVLQAMPEQERALYTNFPIWVTITFCIAVFGSTIGSILLLMRKKFATPVLIISFIAIALQMIYTVFISNALAVLGPGALGVPILVVVFGLLLIWVAKKAERKGWLG